VLPRPEVQQQMVGLMEVLVQNGLVLASGTGLDGWGVVDGQPVVVDFRKARHHAELVGPSMTSEMKAYVLGYMLADYGLESVVERTVRPSIRITRSTHTYMRAWKASYVISCRYAVETSDSRAAGKEGVKQTSRLPPLAGVLNDISQMNLLGRLGHPRCTFGSTFVSLVLAFIVYRRWMWSLYAVNFACK
jgi:hypothetical protein